jgi:hypothetical protein
MPRDESPPSPKRSGCTIYSLDCVRRWRRQSFARKLERNLSRRDIDMGHRSFERSLQSISKHLNTQTRTYRELLLLCRPKSPRSLCLPCDAVSCWRSFPSRGSRSCCSCASCPSVTRSSSSTVSTSWSRVDLPDTEDGTELAVLPVFEYFKELTRPGDWSAEVMLRFELALERLAME